MLRFLTEHGFANIAALGGWYAYSGGPLERDARDPAGVRARRRRRLGARARRDRRARRSAFLTRLRRLGEVTGEMHTVLASDPNDPAFCPETPSVESLGLLTATVDEEIESVFLDAAGRRRAARADRRPRRGGARAAAHAHARGRDREDHPHPRRLPPRPDALVGGRLGDPRLRGRARALADRAPPQALAAARRRRDAPLVRVRRERRASCCAARRAPDGWEEQARAQFLEGYLETVDPTLLPSGQLAIERLLTVFELEKAVYELRYELDNRPDWVGIPVAGIQRLIEQAAATP